MGLLCPSSFLLPPPCYHWKAPKRIHGVPHFLFLFLCLAKFKKSCSFSTWHGQNAAFNFFCPSLHEVMLFFFFQWNLLVLWNTRSQWNSSHPLLLLSEYLCPTTKMCIVQRTCWFSDWTPPIERCLKRGGPFRERDKLKAQFISDRQPMTTTRVKHVTWVKEGRSFFKKMDLSV